uniref:Uncharacterized protein n=1 Tax=Meloidogyne enterolobii TaxID=390850 RepID=A0A6V7VL11_MELEN|nr:unnamed protein product [Meloidogyne enterolobii]
MLWICVDEQIKSKTPQKPRSAFHVCQMKLSCTSQMSEYEFIQFYESTLPGYY